MLIRPALSWTGPALLALAMSAATLARADAAPLTSYGYGQEAPAAGPVFDLRSSLPAMAVPAPAPAPVPGPPAASPVPAARSGEGEVAQCNASSEAGLAATHPVLRQGTLAFVTDLKTRKEVIVRISGRGPTRLSTEASAVLGCRDQTQIGIRDLAPAQATLTSAPRYVETAFVPAKPARTGAFMVQIGAFSDRANAERAKAQADSAGGASIEQISANGRTLYRVRLGPWEDRNDAERAQADARRLGFRDATVTGR